MRYEDGGESTGSQMSIGWQRPRTGGIGCTVRVGDVIIGAVGVDPVSALHAASGLAHDLSSTLEQHPELAVLIPPQATAALKAIRIASWAAKHGKLPEAARTIGPTAVATVRRLLKGIL